MSRRSLRLQTSAGHYGNESLADYSQNHHSSSSSSSNYTNTRRETRTLRSKKQQSSSGALSLSLSQVATPRKTLSFSAVSTPVNSSSVVIQESNTASDASLLPSIVDQSHLRHRTITTTTTTTSTSVDGHWGKSFSADHSSSSVNGDASASKSHTSLANGYVCKDCSLHSQNMDSFITRSSSSSSSSSSQAAEASSGTLSYSSSPFTSIYSRDRSRRNKTGILVSMSNTWPMSPPGKGVLLSFSDSMRRAVSSSLSQLWLFKQTTLHRVMGYQANGYDGQETSRYSKAHSSFCGSMNVKGLVTEDSSHLNLNGSLCDDCKGKQHSETHTVLLTQSSRSRRLAGALWIILAYAGYCLLQPGYCVVRAGKALGSGAATAVQRLLSLFWMLLAAPVKAGRGLLWFLAAGWYQLVSLMSLLNVFFLTRCLPKLWRLLLFLLPLLLLLALWLWGPSTAALLAYLPAINLTEWQTPVEQTPATPVSEAPPMFPPVAVSSVDLERLERVERQLALLWERVQKGDQKQEQDHRDIMGFYSTLREQLHTQTDRESLGLWVSSLLEKRLGMLRGELEEENTHRAQSEEQQKQQQESQATRLADLELLLNALNAKTEEVRHKQQQYEHEKQEREREVVTPAADPVPVSVGVKQEDHDALLVEVQRLEAELGKIRQDLQGVAGCKGKCEQLDTLQETISTQVSSQVRKELQALFFGSGGSGEEQDALPESLVLWLSQRYVSTPDLQASLASLEMSILRNVSLQLELNRAQTLGEAESQAKTIVQTVTGTVQHTATTEGLTEEQVKLIVQNALRLYSQDRTGQVDYALESGGGSILSTRCSETYETKTALMSLFGLPLWYFSQSPRVVIQPDVYPGNCWAFKGSQGYLVIRLSLRILPTSFCVEHIPKALSPTGNITSAPRNFTVFGLDDEYQEEGKLLGNYIYQEDGESLQTFPVMEQNDKTFQIIEVRVLSNWGHPEYTCMYRFRVHGEPRPQ
ncbi:SUN domain-containing protein 1 Protein unc-84-like protein A Sad1/unc-84 protein-like 1 [Larimichthys crocea]|uniref:SUN domain-containing protein 1 Protein unc-84-like protein A Sad1/unc-84 protein-like 1 n=1 Tax=Larimichthys crocea TaxID=215358 RepID=A0A6G0HV95_LARCR|nr:SUN domain-containing protein 1 Protein unc-84-like protein A Sad1/unc-84 protein-like 1 [Larimichthys crocea]